MHLLIDPEQEKPKDIVKLSSIQEKLNAARITVHDVIEIPPSCLEVLSGDTSTEIGTIGNISLFIGKAKQGKTFFVSMALAAAESSGNYIQDKIKVSLPEDKKNVIFFDTEQNKHHVQRVIKRICKLSNISEPVNLETFGLRKYTPAERLELVEYAIQNTENLGFVVIDGIRDLVTSINDEEQSTMIASKLMKWSEEQHIHIVTVLHTNKGDNNARGHIGAELTNKSETVISVSKDDADKELIVITAEYCRNKEFEPFAFRIDEEGLPQIVHTPHLNSDVQSNKVKSPVNVSLEIHELAMDAVFQLKKELKYSDLKLQILDYFKRYGIPFGDNKAKEFITYYLNERYIEQFDPPKGYTLYRRLKGKTVQKHVIEPSNRFNIQVNHSDEQPPF